MTVTSYPTWVYHRTEQPRLVQNEQEHQALPDRENWKDTPAAFYEPEAKLEPIPFKRKGRA